MFERLYVTLQILRGDLQELRENQEGAAMVEYGLLVVGIAVVVGIAAATLGDNIAGLFTGLDFDTP